MDNNIDTIDSLITTIGGKESFELFLKYFISIGIDMFISNSWNNIEPIVLDSSIRLISYDMRDNAWGNKFIRVYWVCDNIDLNELFGNPLIPYITQKLNNKQILCDNSIHSDVEYISSSIQRELGIVHNGLSRITRVTLSSLLVSYRDYKLNILLS